jgi:hypothetical protein
MVQPENEATPSGSFALQPEIDDVPVGPLSIAI